MSGEVHFSFFLIDNQALFHFFGIIDSINLKECDLQGTIVKALAFYYVESDGHIYQTRAVEILEKRTDFTVGIRWSSLPKRIQKATILSIAPRKK